MAKKYRVYIRPVGEPFNESTHKEATDLSTNTFQKQDLPDGDYETIVESYEMASAVPFTITTNVVPNVPAGLTVDDPTPTGFDFIGWNVVSGATSYQVRRANNSGMTSPIQIYDSTGNSTNDSGLTSGTQYWYQVRATNAAGSSAWSTAVSNTTLVQINVIFNLFHGQSQLIGEKSNPRLGHATDSKVLMLGTKPALPLGTTPNDVLALNLQTAEELELSEQGNPVDTMCVALGRDRLSRIGSPASDNYRIINVISGQGAQSIDRLMKGGESQRYEYLLTAAQRVKALCDANFWNIVEVNYNWVHGGTATEGYGAKLGTLIADMRTDFGAALGITGNQIYVFADQIRQRNGFVQEPSIALVDTILQTTNAKVVFNRNLIERVGDIVHMTSNGERHMASYYSACHHETRMGSNQWKTPRMGTITFNENTNELTIPIVDHAGTAVFAGNYGFKVWNETLSQYEPFTIDFTSNVITITLTTIASGSHTLKIRQMWEDDDEDYTRYFGADQVDEASESTRGYLYYQNESFSPAPIFDDVNTTNPYTLYLSLLREEKTVNIEINVSPPTTYTTDYRGATTMDVVVDHPDSVTAYFVLYTTEATRSDATVKADALAIGGTRRAVINNSDSLGSEKFTTWTTLTQNTNYYLHVAVEENSAPDVFVESYNKVAQTRWRHEPCVYYYAPFAREKGVYIYVPETYWKRRNTADEWPLLISYHGNGETVGLGTPGSGQQYDFNLIDNVVYANRIQTGTNYNDWIIISPQYGSSLVPKVAEVEYIINTILKVDRNLKIKDGYVAHGLSGGGGIAYDYALQFPEKMAGGASSAAFLQYTQAKDTPGGNNLTYNLYDDNVTRKLAITPFVAAHNQGDATVGDQQSKRIITGFQSWVGVNSWGVGVTSYLVNPAGGNHNVWDAHVNQTLDYSTALPSAVPQSNILAFLKDKTDNFNLHDKLDLCVQVAEDALTQEYEDWARAAVVRSQSKITTPQYDALIARLDSVSEISAADTAVEQAETSTTQVDYDDAFDLVDALPSSPKKTEFEGRLNVILIGEVATEALVSAAEVSGDSGDITAAQNSVNALDENGNITGTPVTAKTNKITNFQNRINAIGSVHDEVWINIKGGSASNYNGTPGNLWNNTQNRSSFSVVGNQIADCIDRNGVSTGIQIDILDGTSFNADWDNNGAAGQAYCPQEVANSMYQTDASGNVGTIRIKNLDPGLRYIIETFNTRIDSGGSLRQTNNRVYNSRVDADAFNQTKLKHAKANVSATDSGTSGPARFDNGGAGIRPSTGNIIFVEIAEANGDNGGWLSSLKIIPIASSFIPAITSAVMLLLML